MDTTLALPTASDLRGWTLTQFIGDGATAIVYRVDPPTYGKPASSTTTPLSATTMVMKIVPFYRSSRTTKPFKGVQERFAIESHMATWSGSIGMGPRVIASWTTPRFGFIVMEEWDMTLTQWKRRNAMSLPENTMETVRKLIKRAKRAGHCDIKDANIVLRTAPHDDGSIMQVGIIDWGKVSVKPRILKYAIAS